MWLFTGWWWRRAGRSSESRAFEQLYLELLVEFHLLKTFCFLVFYLLFLEFKLSLLDFELSVHLKHLLPSFFFVVFDLLTLNGKLTLHLHTLYFHLLTLDAALFPSFFLLVFEKQFQCFGYKLLLLRNLCFKRIVSHLQGERHIAGNVTMVDVVGMVLEVVPEIAHA